MVVLAYDKSLCRSIKCWTNRGRVMLLRLEVDTPRDNVGGPSFGAARRHLAVPVLKWVAHWLRDAELLPTSGHKATLQDCCEILQEFNSDYASP
jgi:hypothetical protein